MRRPEKRCCPALPQNEPLLDAPDIQGNILPGFRRRQQRLVGFRAPSAIALKAAIAIILENLTDLPAVLADKEVRKAALLAGGSRPARPDLWLNYALGVRATDLLGLQRLRTLEPAFDVGMPLRAGDTTEPLLPDGSPDPTCPQNWRVGGPNRALDLLLILATDEPIESASAALVARIEACGLTRIYSEVGALLQDDKEHFGFQDGISQPGVMGIVEIDGVQRFVTTRYGIPGSLGIDFGKPGQPLLPPEQFLFGNDEDLRNGSFLVFRRLRQDVAAFYAETQSMSDTLATQLGHEVDLAEFRARVVGRWPSGQPLMRPSAHPETPEPAMSRNHFLFASDVPALVLNTGEHVGGVGGDPLVLKGARCPIWSHIRKVNPRDLLTNLGGPDDTRARQMLRRGIPFGPPYHRDDPGHPDNAAERGLLFLAYQASITEQFETLNMNWMNSDTGPMARGFDLLVGQNLADGRHGPKAALYFDPVSGASCPITTLEQWVKPTGGEYLFSPSVSWTRRIALG